MRPLEPRERRTITIGATISLVALALTFIVLPASRRWGEREEAIRLSRERVERLRGLAADGARLTAAAARHEQGAEATSMRVLRGRTPALAASELQRLLQEVARASRVTVSRLDVAEARDGADGASGPVIPATLSAVSDVYGLADLLARLQRSSPLVEVTELQVVPASMLRGGELLQLSITVKAPYLVTP